ncbi:hypothetical protein ZIOFF_030112 [Zingiber officinale]|uniref:GDP-D-glucose phosphorylase 1 n=1 Tax=Zingiber officinale TaxID=94328 RepID=A0A8J5LB43_ZINOF|nr:hypothetical protein ZIOFF_030112 [Zingiber officinale]
MPFPVERAPTQRVPIAKGLLCHGGVKISLLLNYPVRGLVYEGGTSLKDLSDVVSKSCKCLQENNIPFNVLISDSGWRIFLFPQCYAEKQALGEVSEEILETQVNPAVWKISGHMVLKRKKDFEEATEQYAWRLLAEVSLSEARFKEVEDYIRWGPWTRGASDLREEFEANKHVIDNGAVTDKNSKIYYGSNSQEDLDHIDRLIEEAEARFEKFRHPDPYIVPWAPGGSKFCRNPPPYPGIEIVYNHGKEDDLQ